MERQVRRQNYLRRFCIEIDSVSNWRLLLAGSYHKVVAGWRCYKTVAGRRCDETAGGWRCYKAVAGSRRNETAGGWWCRKIIAGLRCWIELDAGLERNRRSNILPDRSLHEFGTKLV